MCDADDYSEVVQTDPFGPFDILHVCVKVEEDSNVVVDSILDLSITQQGTSIYFSAVEDGSVTIEDLVVVDYYDGKCKVSMQLITAFFSEANALDVEGKVRLGAMGSLRGSERITSSENFSLRVSLEQPCSIGRSKLLSKMLQPLV